MKDSTHDVKRREAKNEHARDNQLYSIGAAARVAGFHPQTLRWYEKKGLIKPIRTRGNARRYTAGDIELLSRIKTLSKRGMSLEAVRLVLSLEKERQMLYELVDALRREVSRLSSASDPSSPPLRPHRRSTRHSGSYETGAAASGG
ncbi:MAG: hypothetical protein C4319_04260 [Acidimicrobiia bacterium]